MLYNFSAHIWFDQQRKKIESQYYHAQPVEVRPTILKNDNWSTEHTSISAYWELKHSGSILNLKWWIIQELKHIELL